jgi:hypothetical protein
MAEKFKYLKHLNSRIVEKRHQEELFDEQHSFGSVEGFPNF